MQFQEKQPLLGEYADIPDSKLGSTEYNNNLMSYERLNVVPWCPPYKSSNSDTWTCTPEVYLDIEQAPI